MMNSALLNTTLLSQPLLPPQPTPVPPASSAQPKNLMSSPTMDHNNSSLTSEPHSSSPLRPHIKPENGLSINYEGRVSVLAHAPLYGGGAGDVSTTLDDSREDKGGWTDTDEMSPREHSSSPDMMPKSTTLLMDEDEAMAMARSTGDSLQRLREICNKSLPQHGSTMLETANNEQIQADGSTSFHCHLCSYTVFSREEFNEHVNDHYVFNCPKCEFDTKIEADYKDHLKEEHNLTPEDLDDDQGIRVPKINSQGKVKVFKCKQCEFVAVTKEDFWRHSKQHIKPEKMLNCPKCPFVTEYKHHLEYHLRNHFGSKPFKCPSCSYSCVNKSMLNSHMKSHTNIYQYRCADCNYATKYCHSLKLHLRKYNHKPAMVLNQDGTPNPLPIIDIYGTRRGPKKKPDGSDTGSGAGHSPDGGIGPLGPLPLPPGSPGSPGSNNGSQAPRFPLLPPFVMAQMQMQMQQSLNQSSPNRIAQLPRPPFRIGEDFRGLSPGRRFPERDNSSEMDEDERRSLNGGNETTMNKEKLKCAICDFETDNPDIFRNHLMLHATKDQDSPPPMPPMPLAIPLPQYPLQIRSPLSINAGAKAAAAAAAASAAAASLFRRERPLPSSNVEESPSSSSVKTESEVNKYSNSNFNPDYLEYLKKLAPLLKHQSNLAPSPSGISSTQPPVPSELISRLYFENMVKNFQRPTQTSGNGPDADSSSGALDLSQLKDGESPIPSRPQSGSQPSTTGSTGSKSRRKGKAFKIERKLPDHSLGDRDSLNSGHSGYSNEVDIDEGKSDGSTASAKEATTTGTTNGGGNNGHHHIQEETTSAEAATKSLSGSHVCKFCDIAFMDSIMFRIHMNYHSNPYPYKCNMCGDVMEDRVEFFLHIARKAHS